ncbi:MAG TPA: RNA-binding S4 domain-containing protein [Solirubrobacteraceae bacterium]
MSKEIAIRSDSIKLGQLLKLAGVIDGGGEAKTLLEHEQALVNGEPESRRGRRLVPGDTVRLAGHDLLVVSAGSGGR